MSDLKRKREKHIGWVGLFDNKPCFETIAYDDKSILVADIFKSKKEAKKMFQDIRKVYIKLVSGQMKNRRTDERL